MKMASKIGMFGVMAAALLVVGCAKSTKSEGSMGATSTKATCTEGKSECCASKAAGSMGATSEKASCAEKASCGEKAATCTEKAAAGSMGATSEKKSGCCSSKQN